MGVFLEFWTNIGMQVNAHAWGEIFVYLRTFKNNCFCVFVIIFVLFFVWLSESIEI